MFWFSLVECGMGAGLGVGFKAVQLWTFFRCRLNALGLSYVLMFQEHLPVRLPCYDLPRLTYVVFIIGHYGIYLLGLKRVTGGVYVLWGLLQLGALS